jgi:type I restriction-modification system DNA methylase subunit
MPPKKEKKQIATENVIEHVAPATEVVPTTKFTKMESFLWQIREICRARGFQVWGNQQLVNQIYMDLLFIYHIPHLMAQKILTLDIHAIGDGKLTEVSYTSLLTLKDPEHILAALRVLWSELQNSELKDLFAGRNFILFDIAKKENKKKKCLDLMMDIIKYASKINLEVYDSNAGYTYFKKELNKAIAKTFGQFYTPQTVTNSVVKMVDPKIGETVLDPSCGSCSFLAEAANYMVKTEKVDMNTAFKNLYGIELESNIYAEGIMNMFINFGILPNMKDNIIEKDALIHLLSDTTTYSKIIANPPFGADAKDFKEWYFQTIMVPTKPGSSKMKKKIVENPKAYFKLPFPNTNESAILFFQLIVLKLKEGGKAGVVMSATILNDGFKDMMEWFLNCCSLEKIVINPAGTFKEQGTGIETFSFIFTKGKPTTTVKIVMLGAEDHVVRTLTLDQIKEAGYKLQLKEEEKKVAYNGIYELKKLGDICEFNTNIPKHDTHYGKETGLRPFYTGAANNKLFTDTPDIHHPVIIMNRTNGAGKCNLFIDTECAVAGQAMVFYMKNKDETSLKYLYHYLNTFKSRVEEGYVGSNHKNISNGFMEAFKVEFPPLPIQQEIVTNLDRIFADPQDMKDCLAFTDKAMDLMLKDPTGKQLEDILGGLREKRDCLNLCIRKKSQMAAIVRSVGARGFERKKLGDVVDIEGGEYITKSSETIGEYPVYGGGSASYYINRFNREPTCVINKDGMSASCVQMVNKKFFMNHHGWTLKLKSSEFIEKFLHWQLYFRANEIYNLATGSCQKGLNYHTFIQFTIFCPPLPIQHEVLSILNEMEAELATLEQMAAKAEQRAKFILDGYLTPAITLEAEPVTDPNSIAAFIQQYLTKEDGAEVSINEVVRKYKEWCKSRPEYTQLKLSEFKAALSPILGKLENDKYKGFKLI